MGFFDFLNKTQKNQNISSLEKKISQHFPELTKEKQTLYACYGGLLTRVAYADLHISTQEQERINQVLHQFTKLNSQEITLITEMAIKDMKELSGIDDHYFTMGLSQLLNAYERSEFLIALFAIAACDNSLDAKELEALKNITTGLNLGHQHFIAAKAKFINDLSILNS